MSARFGALLRALVGAESPLVRLVPERRLAIAVAVGAALWALPGMVGWYAGVAGLAIIVLAVTTDILLLPSRSSVVVRREAPDSVGIGDTVPGDYVVSNQGSRGVVVHLFDQLTELVSGGVGEVEVALPPRSTHPVRFELRGAVRGEASLGRIGARVTTRLALVGQRRRFDQPELVRVIPSVSGVRRYRLLALQNRLDAAGVRALRRKGEGQGFAGLREYVRGDEPRHIDWKATSRKAKLITREYTIERSQTVITLVDAGRGMTQLAGQFSRFEQALSAALVLTDIAVNAGDRVGTLVFDDEIRAFVAARQSRGALQAVRDAFVPVVATLREPDYATAFRFLASHQRKRALIVLFTDVMDVRASQSLLAHVSRSSARHLVLVVALRNDSIFAASAPRSDGDTAHLYESAAAEELIQARAEVLERMRRAGVVVVDVSPQVMTASVVNRYLELKSRGAL